MPNEIYPNLPATLSVFFKDTWYDEFIQIQSALARYNNTSEETIYQKCTSYVIIIQYVNRHLGYTKAELNESYGILSNACIFYPYNSVFVYERNKDEIKMKALRDLKKKNFYCKKSWILVIHR